MAEDQLLDVRLRVAAAAAARDPYDALRAFAATADVREPADMIRAAREVRLATVALLDLCALIMLTDGASWADLTCALGRGDEGAVRAYYEPMLHAWASADTSPHSIVLDRTAPFRADRDPLVTAHLVEQWLERVREVYDPQRAPGALVHALTDGA